MNKRIVITGGSGFIGSYLVKKLVVEGFNVCVVDNLSRGESTRFKEVSKHVEMVRADVRDEEALTKAFKKADFVYHLAAINGTDNFYKYPELVLDVGIKGAIAVVKSCIKSNITKLIVASTAEVYQEPGLFPTPENIPLKLPNSHNPRYSYGGSKIATELIALNYGRNHFETLQIFRPHNVYGPNMGWKHVIPQFIMRIAKIKNKNISLINNFSIQGNGVETRAFAYIDDIIDGLLIMQKYGVHRNIYNIGNQEEVSIKELIYKISSIMGVELQIETGEPALGGTKRRCPDISKISKLGYKPKVNLECGLKLTADWYLSNINLIPKNDLM
jgi:UDP-glucose 4-epimerase